MTKKNQLKLDFLYPFCQHKPYTQFKIGAFTWQQRWAIINKHLKRKDTFENVSLYPDVELLNEVKETKKLPSPLYHRCLLIDNPIALLKKIPAIIEFDIAAKNQQPLSKSIPQIINQVTKNIFIEKGVDLKPCYMNTDNGPIYISKNAQIQEGACLRGPLWIGENTIVKMGATIYGNTIIGNNCLVNGEIKNSILMDNSNKAHFGYLGDSIIGEWCNLGAGTSNSNLKNNASEIKIHLKNEQLNAGFKMGVLMGDYSRTAIHTAINTGTVIGISANVFCNGLTPKTIPNFAWGVKGEKYIVEKAIVDMGNWMAFKNKKLSVKEINIIKAIYKNENK